MSRFTPEDLHDQEFRPVIQELTSLSSFHRRRFFDHEFPKLSERQQDLLLWYVSRQRARSDLYWFARYILGYHLLYEPLHRPFAESITTRRPSRFMLNLFPRGHFKTTLVSVSGTIWRVINDPEVRILVAHSILDLAKPILHEIKQHFIRNREFRHLFPEFVPGQDDGLFGTSENFTVPNKSLIRKDPTVRVGAADATLVSSHYNHIVMDDMVDEKNSRTQLGRDKVDLWRQQAMSLLDPEGTIDAVGTRWHDDDMYGRILGRESSQWSINKNVLRDESFNYILPKRTVTFTMHGRVHKIVSGYDRKEEETLRQEQDLHVFMAQYFNDPISAQDAKFKRAHLHYWNELPDPTREPVRVTTTVDPAISDMDGSCYSGIVTCCTNDAGDVYVAEAKRVRGDMDVLIEAVFGTVLKWGVQTVGIEDVAYQKALLKPLRVKQIESGVFFAVVPLRSYKTKSKDLRIETLVPFWTSGRILIGHDQTELREELLRYPAAKYRDLLDALAYQMELLKLPTSRRKDPRMLLSRSDAPGADLETSEFPEGSWGRTRAFLDKTSRVKRRQKIPNSAFIQHLPRFL